MEQDHDLQPAELDSAFAALPDSDAAESGRAPKSGDDAAVAAGKAHAGSVDMASYYAAAASAATSGHVFDPNEGNMADSSPAGGQPDGIGFAPVDEGEDPSGQRKVSSDGSPHGPLKELAEECDADTVDPASEKNGETAQAAAMQAVHADPSLPGRADDEDDENDGEDDGSMGILDHLGELRKRLMRMFIVVFLGWIALYGVSEMLYGYLSAPLQACLPEGSKLIYTSPAGAFFTYLKVAFIASLFATCPYTFYQAWAFIAPGLYREEKRALLPLALCSSLFFVGGAAFCFFLVFPLAFKFFMGFATDTIVPMISVEEYLSFALKLLIAFGLVFEMPLFSFFLSRFGLLTPSFMRRTRGYAILLIFVVAAILTPPDVISQILMAVPMMVLYEVSIYVSKMAYREKESDKQKEEKP